MNTALWILQILLALAFLITGVRKFLRSDEQTRAIPWAKGMEPGLVRGIGVVELLGAAGVILPTLTGILPWLTPVAAVGLGLTMIGAAFANYRVSLYTPIVANFILLLMAAFLAYGRFVLVPIA